MLQQHLPFTVLKLYLLGNHITRKNHVATALTVYGIETFKFSHFICRQNILLQQHLPFTVLKPNDVRGWLDEEDVVATALTVYGIET